MQAVDKEVLGQILKWLENGQPCWLATVVQTWGSSPRPVGSVLACNANGHIVGSLSGGCVEDDLLEKITAGELAANAAQFFQYGITAEETEKLGLPCGGHLYIVVEPQKPTAESIQHFTQLNDALDQRQCARRIVNLQEQTAQIELNSSFKDLHWDDAKQQLDHTFGPRQQLFIIGAGMVSQYLADMAKNLDYEITVCDPREDLLTSFNIDGVRKICDMPDDAIRLHARDAATAIVALTHDPRIDDMGLMEALTTDAFYIGAMGSTRSSASRRERLLTLDIAPQDIEKLYAPIGLPIGSKTPPEIAIAILAEITAVKKNRRDNALQKVTELSAASA
jgi:xanthine dehydrogenase accessory factor